MLILNNVLKQSFSKAFVAMVLTVFIYQFYHIEFLRSSIEDAAFDTTSWFALSKTTTDTNQSNVFILLLDDNYLKSKNLLDENNETNYGYILPREYLAELIVNLDTLVEDIDEENYPSALFVDYDLSYLSDPHNRIASSGDIELLEVLKRPRHYVVYLPMTSNYNFIYHSKDEEIQRLIDEEKIKFVSVGLTSASDNVSRRYYPYERYKDIKGEEKKFTNIAIELYLKENTVDESVIEDFSQEGIALVENRIIFKDVNIIENKEYLSWQSNWKKLSAFSANYPLDMIYEDDIRGAVFMVGAAHSESSDSFEIDAFSKEISGIEMHANALMTLSYLEGKLKRLPLYWSALIVFVVVALIDFILAQFYIKLSVWREKLHSVKLRKLSAFFIHEEQDDFHEFWLVVLSLVIMFVVSYKLLLSSEHYWFNWMIPALMYFPYLFIMGFKKLFN